MTAANGFLYSIGAKNSFEGTGVWSFIKMQRPGSQEVQKKEADLYCDDCEVKMMKPKAPRLHDPDKPALKKKREDR